MNVNYVDANHQVTSFGNYFPSLEDDKGISNYLKITIASCIVKQEISELKHF
jgi:hypothetical protein